MLKKREDGKVMTSNIKRSTFLVTERWKLIDEEELRSG